MKTAILNTLTGWDEFRIPGRRGWFTVLPWQGLRGPGYVDVARGRANKVRGQLARRVSHLPSAMAVEI
jgi:hypothetical protein